MTQSAIPKCNDVLGKCPFFTIRWSSFPRWVHGEYAQNTPPPKKKNLLTPIRLLFVTCSKLKKKKTLKSRVTLAWCLQFAAYVGLKCRNLRPESCGSLLWWNSTSVSRNCSSWEMTREKDNVSTATRQKREWTRSTCWQELFTHASSQSHDGGREWLITTTTIWNKIQMRESSRVAAMHPVQGCMA